MCGDLIRVVDGPGRNGRLAWFGNERCLLPCQNQINGEGKGFRACWYIFFALLLVILCEGDADINMYGLV